MRKENSTNRLNQKAITQDCPITSTMLAIGGRWKLPIIWNLYNKTLRFSEIKRAIPKISEKMLIQQLKELVQDGWIVKKDYNQIPPRTEYRLTELGNSFIPILKSIYEWGTENKITTIEQKNST